MRTLLGVVSAAFALLTSCEDTTASNWAIVTSRPASDKDIALLVQGWGTVELAAIIDEFERRYELDEKTFELTEVADGTSRIRLRQSVPASHVLFLVNYLHYPEGLDFSGRSPVAVAVVRLGPAFGITEPPLLGRTAAFYVPANDVRFDEVYVVVDDGSAFRVSFTNLGWEPVSDARRSRAVEAIQKVVPAF